MYLTTKTWNQAASYRFVGNLALAPMADRPLTLRRLLASHRDHRANLLGGVCRTRARARRLGEPLRHTPGRRRPRAGGGSARPRPGAANRRAAPAHTGRDAPVAGARANTAPSSATRRVPARSRARQYRRQPAISCGLARPTVVSSSGLVPASPALRAAPAQQAPDRRPTGASQPPVSASDSSCHNAADSTPVLSPKSSLAQTTFVPSRKAESQLPLGGTSGRRACAVRRLGELPRPSFPSVRGRTA